MIMQTPPQQGEGDLRLRDGTLVHVRPIQPADAVRLRAMHARLSMDSIVHRFFAYVPVLSEGLAQRFTHVDGHDTMAYVATLGAGADEQIIGVVRYVRTDATTAELAFTVEDHWQGRGIATALLYRLVGDARSQGFTALVATIMTDNVHMLEVIAHCGIPARIRHQDEAITATLDITAPCEDHWLAFPSVN
jgi:RimJ/RimL family protein N-acetyltransferase